MREQLSGARAEGKRRECSHPPTQSNRQGREDGNASISHLLICTLPTYQVVGTFLPALTLLFRAGLLLGNKLQAGEGGRCHT